MWDTTTTATQASAELMKTPRLQIHAHAPRRASFQTSRVSLVAFRVSWLSCGGSEYIVFVATSRAELLIVIPSEASVAGDKCCIYAGDSTITRANGSTDLMESLRIGDKAGHNLIAKTQSSQLDLAVDT